MNVVNSKVEKMEQAQAAHTSLRLCGTEELRSMTSLEIAELTGKRHDSVLRDIRAMLEELEIGAHKFVGTYLDVQNKPQPMYNLPKRECLTLVSGYSAKLRAAIIDRWLELEEAQAEQAAQAHAQLQGDYATLHGDYRSLSFGISISKASVRADVFDWTRRFDVLVHAHRKTVDQYGYRHTPKQAVALLEPYAEEAMELIKIALQIKPSMWNAMMKEGIDRKTAIKVIEEILGVRIIR